MSNKESHLSNFSIMSEKNVLEAIEVTKEITCRLCVVFN